MATQKPTTISLGMRISLAMESFLMTYLVPRGQPGPFWKWIFKLPVVQYRIG